jgi:hypothetical protein
VVIWEEEGEEAAVTNFKVFQKFVWKDLGKPRVTFQKSQYSGGNYLNEA